MSENNQLRVNYEELDVQDDYRYTYSGKLFTGIAFEENDVGQLLAEVSFVDGVKNGVSCTYYPSGRLQVEKYLCRGGVEGLCRCWYENGQLEAERIYDEHHALIKERRWNENGELVKDW